MDGEDIKALIRIADLIHTYPQDFPFKGNEHPFNYFLMNFVYPELINTEGCLRDELLTYELKEFKEGIISDEEKTFEAINNLALKPINREDLVYYTILKDSIPYVSSKVKEKIYALLEVKLEESSKVVRDYAELLNSSLKINQAISKIKEEGIRIKALDSLEKVNKKSVQELMKLLDDASVIELINQYKPRT